MLEGDAAAARELRQGSGEADALLTGQEARRSQPAGSFDALEVGSTSPGAADAGGAAAAKKGEFQSLLAVCYELRLQLLGAGVYGFIFAAKNVSFLPFIRTMIQCESDLAPEDRHSPHWSGSAFCNDLGLVARDAQYMKGWAEGLDQGFHCVALPLLGHAIDCFGRRWGVLVGMVGVLLQCAFFFIGSVLGVGVASNAMLIIGSVVQGLTGIFMAAVNASVRDMQLAQTKSVDSKSESHAFGVLQVGQGCFSGCSVALVTALVVAQNLDSYTAVWFGYTVLAALATVVLFAYFPETLVERQEWQWRKASPLRLVEMVYDDSAQRWVALMVFFEVFSLSSLTTLQAFVISTYHWSQTKSTVAFMVLAPIVVLSVAASFYVIPRFGPQRVLIGTLVFMDVSMVFFSLASLDPVFVFVAVGFLLATVGAMPAMMQTITSLAGADEVGQLLANMGAVALAAVALGNVFYGFVFRTFPQMPSLSFLLAVPFMLVATVCAVKAKRVFDELGHDDVHGHVPLASPGERDAGRGSAAVDHA